MRKGLEARAINRYVAKAIWNRMYAARNAALPKVASARDPEVFNNTPSPRACPAAKSEIKTAIPKDMSKSPFQAFSERTTEARTTKKAQPCSHSISPSPRSIFPQKLIFQLCPRAEDSTTQATKSVKIIVVLFSRGRYASDHASNTKYASTITSTSIRNHRTFVVMNGKKKPLPMNSGGVSDNPIAR